MSAASDAKRLWEYGRRQKMVDFNKMLQDKREIKEREVQVGKLERLDIGNDNDFAEPVFDLEDDGPSGVDVDGQSKVVVPRCEFITGGAGTGKTTLIRKRMEQYLIDNPGVREYGVLAATTGIAAINLGDGTTTINSLLKFFDAEGLEESYSKGDLQRHLKEISRVADNAVIDEISMMHAQVLDLIWNGLCEVNQLQEVKDRGGLGLILTGDFCQLPPVPNKDPVTQKAISPKYAFEALCWKHFEAHTTVLTKVWRQDDMEFVKALDYARRGDGENCTAVLCRHPGVKFNSDVDNSFEGTTVFAKNKLVDRHNTIRLNRLLHEGHKAITVKSFRWGVQRSEWKSNIPEQLDLCDDAYVMILANDSKVSGFRYANGSTGYVSRFVEEDKTFWIRLRGKMSACPKCLDGTELDMGQEDYIEGSVCQDCKGTGKVQTEVDIRKINRRVYSREHPDSYTQKPEYDSLKEWKEKNKDEFSTAKQAKFLYQNYLSGLTEENKTGHKFEIKSREETRTEIDKPIIEWAVCNCKWKSVEVDTTLTQDELLVEKKSARQLGQEHIDKQPPIIFFDYEQAKWVIGEIYYYPIRLAYASTVHKSQGLTLDNVQVDFIDHFFGEPSMAYVALSRVRTAEGLRLVGTPRLLADRCNVSRKVMRFI
jgi:hypothetical protein